MLDPSIRGRSRQVHAALRSAIVDGLLAPGLRLPSSRTLAEQLGIRRNAVVAAYEHLLSDGLLDARHGAGTYVTSHLPTPVPSAPKAKVTIQAGPRRPFALGLTIADNRLLSRFGTALRNRVAMATPGELGYGDARGSELLRSEIARNIGVTRGVRCDPSCIFVVSGTQHAIRLCTDALLSPGDGVLIEDPGYHAAKTTLTAVGMRLVPVPVDAEGIVLSCDEPFRLAKAAYVTPSHQFPTGVTMSMRRRIALLDWAKSTQAWILEDDYDSEFRYDGGPLTALAGIGGERVIYIGTFSKTLFAGLRLAYLVVPPDVVERIMMARAAMDRFPPRFTQDAVADLMADGTLATHTRRIKSRYREARDVLVATLRKEAGNALRVDTPSQGLHFIAYLPDGFPTDAARQIRNRASIEAKLLSETRIMNHGPEGFILGFSGHDPDRLVVAARQLGSVAREYVGQAPGCIRT